MAINIPTDKHTDKVLAWLAKKLNLSKAETVRTLIRQKYESMQQGFVFGSLAQTTSDTRSATLQREIKELDSDDDLA